MSVHEQTLAVPLSLHGIFVTFVYLLPLLEDRDCVFFMSVFPVLDRCFSTQKNCFAMDDSETVCRNKGEKFAYI